jgi:hypothetical protein
MGFWIIVFAQQPGHGTWIISVNRMKIDLIFMW